MSNAEVFSIRDGEFQIRLDDKVLPTTWNSKGAALAAIPAEAKRLGIHLLSRDCWCKPEVYQPERVPS